MPVVTARGRFGGGGDPLGLLGALAGVGPPLRPYAWVGEGAGCAGLSPELLVHLEGRTLRTMALAGTARRQERDAFAVDEKEIREHEFVAQNLLAKLSDLGATRRHPREIMDLGPLVHFHSGFEVHLESGLSLERLVRTLHPTPALGPLPRTAETLGQLIGWREALGCPPWFGAPFGLLADGAFEALVAIRMVTWNRGEVMVPSFPSPARPTKRPPPNPAGATSTSTPINSDRSTWQLCLVPHPVLPAVRMQRVQTLTFLATPLITIVLCWMLGTKRRLVRRLEKLTFRPYIVCLPHTSHLPAMVDDSLPLSSRRVMARQRRTWTRAAPWSSTRRTPQPARARPEQVRYSSACAEVEQWPRRPAGGPESSAARSVYPPPQPWGSRRCRSLR